MGYYFDQKQSTSVEVNCQKLKAVYQNAKLDTMPLPGKKLLLQL